MTATPRPGSSKQARVRRPGNLNPPSGNSCCSIAAAGRAVGRGKYRLAARYVRMTPRYLAQHFA